MENAKKSLGSMLMATKQAQGSVFYNKDRKNWIASYVVQNLTTGKPKRIRKSFATEKLAK